MSVYSSLLVHLIINTAEFLKQLDIRVNYIDANKVTYVGVVIYISSDSHFLLTIALKEVCTFIPYTIAPHTYNYLHLFRSLLTCSAATQTILGG